MRLNSLSSAFERHLIARVLPSPGRPSSRTFPLASKAMTSRSTTRSWPITWLLTRFLISRTCSRAAMSLLLKGIDGFPVGLHVDHGPAARWRLIECLVEPADGGLAVVGPFPLSIGVVDDQAEARRVVDRCPLQHL